MRGERPINPQEYGKLPVEPEHESQHELYDRAMQALHKDFGQLLEHLSGHNRKNIEAFYALLHWMLVEDYKYELPEGQNAAAISGIDYDDFQKNLTTVAQYIQENRPQH